MNKPEMPMPSPQEREAALFALAVEKPVAERAVFLQAVCGKDSALRQRLEALLAAHNCPDDLLGDGVATIGATATAKHDLADAPDEAVGLNIGRYKLLERLGEGGCGVVYVAEQTEPVRREIGLWFVVRSWLLFVMMLPLNEQQTTNNKLLSSWLVVRGS